MNVTLFTTVSAQYSNRPLFHPNRSNWLEIIIRFDDCIERDTSLCEPTYPQSPLCSRQKPQSAQIRNTYFEMINCR